ncbi:MAG: hypothetical protein J2P46_18485, partial [Zavarzinella sp.]|nr:hypothetical protein [Zavarzinella sp.]
PDGKSIHGLSDLQVNQFIQTKSATYALTGVAHLILDYGSVIRFDRKPGEWTLTEVAKLPGCGWAGTAVADGRLLVAASDRLVRVSPKGAVETLLSDVGGYYANSVTVGPDEKVYIGMRQFVAVYDPKDRAGFVHLRAPTKDALRLPK